MHQDYTRICRICLSEGSRDIFTRSVGNFSGVHSPSNFTTQTCSPLDRLVEKLRYVTMMKLEENDDLPKLLCDLCIVQLNVAYNFKRQAVENDTKLRQYFIENGICSSRSVAHSSPTPPVVTSGFNTNVPEGSRTTANTNRNFPVVPFILKIEPIETDCLSETTTDTITDQLNSSNSSSSLAQTSNHYTEHNINDQESIQIKENITEISQSIILQSDTTDCINLTSMNDKNSTTRNTTENITTKLKTATKPATKRNEINKETRVLNTPLRKNLKKRKANTVLHATEEIHNGNLEKANCDVKIDPDTIYCEDSSKSNGGRPESLSEQNKQLIKEKRKRYTPKHAGYREIDNLKINMVVSLPSSSSSLINSSCKRKSNSNNVKNEKRVRNYKSLSDSIGVRELRQNLAKKYVNSVKSRKTNEKELKKSDDFVLNPCSKHRSSTATGGRQEVSSNSVKVRKLSSRKL